MAADLFEAPAAVFTPASAPLLLGTDVRKLSNFRVLQSSSAPRDRSTSAGTGSRAQRKKFKKSRSNGSRRSTDMETIGHGISHLFKAGRPHINGDALIAREPKEKMNALVINSTALYLKRLKGDSKPSPSGALVGYSDSEESDDAEEEPPKRQNSLPKLNGTTSPKTAQPRLSNGHAEPPITPKKINGIQAPETPPASPATPSSPKKLNGTAERVYGPQLPPHFVKAQAASCSREPEVNGESVPKRHSLGSKLMAPRSLLGKQAATNGHVNQKLVYSATNGSSNKENGHGKLTERPNGLFQQKRPLEHKPEGPPNQRRRLLSERGEEAQKHPILDRAVISHWKWTSQNRIGRCTRGAGLVNHRNDCFMNSCLQIVVHTAPLARFVHDHVAIFQTGCPSPCLLCMLKRQVTESFNSSHAIRNQMMNASRLFFKNHIPGRQEDAHEAFLHLLDGIDAVAMPGVKPASRSIGNERSKSTPSEQIFGMTIRYRGVCRRCQHESNGYERMRVLELGMDKWKQTSVKELIARFFRTEQLNDYKCEKCAFRGAYSRTAQLLRPPAVLVLLIQRFSVLRKVHERVFMDHELDLESQLVDWGQDRDIHGPARYRLRGIIEHHGCTIGSGHYQAYHTDVTGQQWFSFDDEIVGRASEADIRRTADQGCYLLSYHRVSHC